jgi:hypothetical protein
MRGRALVALAAGAAFAGCFRTAGFEAPRAFSAERHTRVALEACRSRLDGVDPKVAENASHALRRAFAKSGRFEVVDDGDVVASCDIERYSGTFLGHHATRNPNPMVVAQLAVALWERPGDELLVVARGKNAVRYGDLAVANLGLAPPLEASVRMATALDASVRILTRSAEAAVDQLEAWSDGESPR